MKIEDIIKFKPRYSPEVNLVLGDGFTFQWSGEDGEGEYIMYNNCSEVIEEEGELKIEWNGGHYDPYHFLYCDHLDGHISMDAIEKTHNWKTGESFYK